MGHYTASMKRVRGIARRMEERMGWTRERPTQEGWYWWRRPDYEPTMAEVFEHGTDGLLVWLPSDQLREGALSIASAWPDTEWQGPIRPEP